VIDGLDVVAIELTAREAQLVELARQGLSNADIADRLVISVRTVETHLYRGMHKLGVRDRHDLWAARRAPVAVGGATAARTACPQPMLTVAEARGSGYQ
jgi:DNA-binding CsgD family transcriptional regulator